MSLNPTGSARWRDLYRSRGELPLDRSRFRASALLRLAVVMPFAVGPTQWFMRQALDKAHAPEEAVLAVQLHLGAAVVYVLANIWLFFITGPEAPSRPRLSPFPAPAGGIQLYT